MNKILEEFVTGEEKYYTFRIGKAVASSLTGFIAGFIVGTLVWITYFLPKLP